MSIDGGTRNMLTVQESLFLYYYCCCCEKYNITSHLLLPLPPFPVANKLTHCMHFAIRWQGASKSDTYNTYSSSYTARASNRSSLLSQGKITVEIQNERDGLSMRWAMGQDHRWWKTSHALCAAWHYHGSNPTQAL